MCGPVQVHSRSHFFSELALSANQEVRRHATGFYTLRLARPNGVEYR